MQGHSNSTDRPTSMILDDGMIGSWLKEALDEIAGEEALKNLACEEALKDLACEEALDDVAFLRGTVRSRL